MALSLNVQASVLDIRSDSPKSNDVFLVDTNVWYWITYSRASLSSSLYQVRDYPSYISQALRCGAKLFRVDLSFIELANIIEKDQYDVFNAINPCKKKEYRYNYAIERARVVTEIESAWKQVEKCTQSLPISVDEQMLEGMKVTLKNYPIEGYDLCFVEALKQEGVTGIITDDCDFTCIPGIQVYTANISAITAATTQGKIVVR